MYKSFIKPILDVLLSTIGLIVLSPIFLVVALVIMITNWGSPFFYQKRMGKNEREIKIIKFKTMIDKTEKNKHLSDSERVTKLGSFIRATSLDELPQLLNVIKGDMSIVGPRPLLFHTLHLYSDEQRRRHELKPGITGLAQVSGRNNISWTQKFKYDVEYVDNISFFLDIKIIFLTVLKIFKSEGVNDAQGNIAEDFNGYN